MFKKFLILEEIDSIKLGIVSLLEHKFEADIRSTKCCDEAYLKVKKSLFEKEPFDLIITDLSFSRDNRDTKITSGEQFIMFARKELPGVKIIVYSTSDRPYKIRSLFENNAIDAYVRKGRESTRELLEAIQSNYEGNTYISPQISTALKDDTLNEINEYDIKLLKKLSNGFTQDEISYSFKEARLSPSSVSSIEKRINKLKISFKAKNTIHLIAISKDIGII